MRPEYDGVKFYSKEDFATIDKPGSHQSSEQKRYNLLL